MKPTVEKRLLQAAVALACLAPLSAGTMGLVRGAAWPDGSGVNLDSHFRYMSGIFLGLGIAFVTCIPDIDRKAGRFRLLGPLTILGGIGRACSWLQLGPPSAGMRFGLGMELWSCPCCCCGRRGSQGKAAQGPGQLIANDAAGRPSR